MKITLKAARVNAGLTQDDVARELRISKGTLVNYEKYRTIPDIETAKKIGVKTEELRNDKYHMLNSPLF